MIPIIPKLQRLKEVGTLDEFEYNIMKTLSEVVYQYKKGIVSLTFLRNCIDQFKTEWTSHYGPMQTIAGQASAYVLSISDSSIEWWSENGTNTRVVPYWVAADVGGAIVGTVIEGGKQYILYKKINNWKSIGCKAL